MAVFTPVLCVPSLSLVPPEGQRSGCTQQSNIVGDLDEIEVTLQVLLDTGAGFQIHNMRADIKKVG